MADKKAYVMDQEDLSITRRLTELKRSIRLVAVDLDGTLLRSDKNISRRTGSIIAQAQAQGVKIVLSTARPPRSVRHLAEALKLTTLQINYNGALIQEPGKRKPFFHLPLCLETAREVIQVARRVDPKVVVSLEILDQWYTDFVDPSLPTETSVHFMPDYVGPLEAILCTPVTKLMLLAPPERLKPVLDRIKLDFRGEVSLAVSDRHLLQVTHPEVDKARGLARIAEHYGVDREEVMAIGDAPNDLSMITWAGVGVAVDNAWDEVKRKASLIVPSNDQDGVAHAIEKYVLGDGALPAAG